MTAKPYRPGLKWSTQRRRDAGLDSLDAETKAALGRLGCKAGDVLCFGQRRGEARSNLFERLSADDIYSRALAPYRAKTQLALEQRVLWSVFRVIGAKRCEFDGGRYVIRWPLSDASKRYRTLAKLDGRKFKAAGALKAAARAVAESQGLMHPKRRRPRQKGYPERMPLVTAAAAAANAKRREQREAAEQELRRLKDAERERQRQERKEAERREREAREAERERQRREREEAEQRAKEERERQLAANAAKREAEHAAFLRGKERDRGQAPRNEPTGWSRSF